MRKYSVIIAAVLALVLCGCSDRKGSSDTSTSSSSADSSVSSVASTSVFSSSTENSSTITEITESTSVENSESSVPIVESDPQNTDETFLVGLAGDKILKSEITSVFTNDGSDCLPQDLTEDKFSAVLCNGFAYVAQTSGASRNSIDNADVYDSVNMCFTDMNAVPEKNYIRLNVGDTINGLVLTSAETNFARGSDTTVFDLSDGSRKKGAELGIPEIYFAASSAKFEGEMTLTGYISKVAADEYGIAAGDILFVPTDGGEKFPVMSYRLDGDNGFYHTTQVYSLSGLTWQNSFGYMYLGNARDTTADISALPEDGSFVKATVTVDNFELNCGVNFSNSVKAQIKDIRATPHN